MSQQEEDAVVGRIVRDSTAKARHLEILHAEVERLGKVYERLSSCLRRQLQYVDYIRFDGEPLPYPLQAPYPGFEASEFQFSSADINGDKLKALCKEIRETRADVLRLSQQLKNLGL